MKVRERLTVRLGFRRTPAMCAQMSISGEAPVVYRGEEVDDDVPRDERDSMVTTAASIFSR
jgi:hypothetical protein